MLPLTQMVSVAKAAWDCPSYHRCGRRRLPSPAQDWEDDAISLIELLRLDRAASFVFRISGPSVLNAGIYDNDVVVDRDTRPAEGHIVIAIVDGGFVCRQFYRRRGAVVLEAWNAQQIYEPTPAEGVKKCGASCGPGSATIGADAMLWAMVDIANFYVSAERLFDPGLRGEPGRRGCARR